MTPMDWPYWATMQHSPSVGAYRLNMQRLVPKESYDILVTHQVKMLASQLDENTCSAVSIYLNIHHMFMEDKIIGN